MTEGQSAKAKVKSEDKEEYVVRSGQLDIINDVPTTGMRHWIVGVSDIFILFQIRFDFLQNP